MLKSRISKPYLPHNIIVNKADIFEEACITNEFNDIFTKIGPKAANKILETMH